MNIHEDHRYTDTTLRSAPEVAVAQFLFQSLAMF